MVFDAGGTVRGRAYSEFTQYYPRPGWVEHDPEEIWAVSLQGDQGGAARGQDRRRATWRRSASPTSARPPWCGTARSGRPVHRAIVWQDRRTRRPLRAAQGRRARGRRCAPRPAWSSIPTSPAPSCAGCSTTCAGCARRVPTLAFGTIDSWLIWKLTGGRVHVTDYTNASRTLLFDIHARRWDDELLRVLQRAATRSCRRCVPSSGRGRHHRPDGVRRRGADRRHRRRPAGRPVRPGLLQPGMAKNTYGTGCFMLMYTGDDAGGLEDGLLTTSPARPTAGRRTRWRARSSSPARRCSGCATGSACSSRRARASAARAQVDSTLGVYVVPAFVGLGAPYWDAARARRHRRPDARRDARAPGARHARVARLPDARRRRHHGGRVRPRRSPGCASTAAPRRTTS